MEVLVMFNKIRFYVGTYTEPIKFGTGQIFIGKGEGIYLTELDLQTGYLKTIGISKDIVNPSYFVINKQNGFLYAVNELKQFEGKASGSVSSFKISRTTGELTFINMQPTGGTDPCHIEVNSQSTEIFVSNFMSGSICILPIRPDGSIGEPSQFIQHTGSSINPQRQSGPHAHSLIFSPDERYAFVPDLGLDKLMVYKTNSGSSPLAESGIPYFQTKPGAGPRHGVFNPTGKYFYLINELSCTILVLSYDSNRGGLTELQSVSSLPEGVDLTGNSCADIHITPNGEFLYGSNRGHNSLIIYGIDQQTGLLKYIGCQPCGGRIPRNFVLDPSGNFLLCANQDSDDITVFKIDQKTGLLKETSKCRIPTPVCVRPLVL